VTHYLRFTRRYGFWPLLAALLCCRTEASAATIDDCKISHDHQRYKIDFDATLNTSPARAYAVISDVNNYPRIDPLVTRVQIIGPLGDPEMRLAVEARVCLAWFCRSLRELQSMTFIRQPDGGDVTASVLPLLSDFRYGRTEWHVRGTGQMTLLRVVAELEPAIDVPPLIGPWLVTRALRLEAERSVAAIEQLAQR
jgi:Polyketide cyclase / dehydrase and lipid transport